MRWFLSIDRPDSPRSRGEMPVIGVVIAAASRRGTSPATPRWTEESLRTPAHGDRLAGAVSGNVRPVLLRHFGVHAASRGCRSSTD